MDPDAVVILASAALKGSSSHQAAELRSIEPATLQYGTHPLLNHRILPVLDALAEVCVKEGGSNVVAVALKMRSPVIELTVATNYETPKEETIEHMRDVLQLLQNISNQRFPGGKNGANLREKYPPLDITEEMVPLYDELLIRIYNHSYAKVEKRHKKYWPVLEKFAKLHHQWARAKEKDKDFVDDTGYMLGEMKEFLQRTQLTNHRLAECRDSGWIVDVTEMEKLKVAFQNLLDHALTILADLTVCEIWAERHPSVSNGLLRRSSRFTGTPAHF
ncbi:hypothetical protein K440DRAFT_687595 [Wilcoxina mikolae CBS 423.85]|nr:hypothetical protein K440DRAFT_687595 [Wilcoxina mikolae CBS 423.85]